MKQSRVKRLAVFFFSFFHPTLFSFLPVRRSASEVGAKGCVLAGPAAEREWAFNSSSQYGRHSQTARSDLTRRDLYQAGCLHSYSCSPISDGTLSFIQPKAPILSDVVPKGPHFA
jgi:hypothetical protein